MCRRRSSGRFSILVAVVLDGRNMIRELDMEGHDDRRMGIILRSQRSIA